MLGLLSSPCSCSATPTSSTRSASSTSAIRGVGRSRTYSMASLASRAARSMVLRMVGASARVRSSSLRASRSDKQPRRRQHVAQVVVDLVGRRADLGQPRLLPQRGAQLALQVLELAVDHADLVVASGRRPLGARLLGRAAERHHVGRQILQRPDHQPAQREIEQDGGEQRDDDGEHQDARGVAVHGDAHRQLVDDDPHHGMRQAHRFAADADVARAVMRHRRQRVPDQRRTCPLP